MSVESPVQAQFAAYNAHDIEAFIACFAEDFKGYRMPAESPSMEGKAALKEFSTRHTSSCLGVACAQPAESHSLSMLIDGLNLAPTSNSNYFGYILITALIIRH